MFSSLMSFVKCTHLHSTFDKARWSLQTFQGSSLYIYIFFRSKAIIFFKSDIEAQISLISSLLDFLGQILLALKLIQEFMKDMKDHLDFVKLTATSNLLQN